MQTWVGGVSFDVILSEAKGLAPVVHEIAY